MKAATRSSMRGFSMLDLAIIIAAVAGIIFIILPPLTRHRCCSSPQIQCINQLKQVGLAFRIWAADNNGQYPMQLLVSEGGAQEAILTNDLNLVFQVMSNELNTPKLLFCPGDQTRNRSLATTFDPAVTAQRRNQEKLFSAAKNLSYFVGVDALESEPNRFLAGDDHLTVAGKKPAPGLLSLTPNSPMAWRNERHPKRANVLLADGSVASLRPADLPSALQKTGLATNRLAMP